jgi:hypothetical protein
VDSHGPLATQPLLPATAGRCEGDKRKRLTTVLPSSTSMRHNAATDHIITWRIACNVEGILAWLFE